MDAPVIVSGLGRVPEMMDVDFHRDLVVLIMGILAGHGPEEFLLAWQSAILLMEAGAGAGEGRN